MNLAGVCNNDKNTKFDSETLGFRPTHVRIRVTFGKLFNFPYVSFLTCKMGIRTGGPGVIRRSVVWERVHIKALGGNNVQ